MSLRRWLKRQDELRYLDVVKVVTPLDFRVNGSSSWFCPLFHIPRQTETQTYTYTPKLFVFTQAQTHTAKHKLSDKHSDREKDRYTHVLTHELTHADTFAFRIFSKMVFSRYSRKIRFAAITYTNPQVDTSLQLLDKYYIPEFLPQMIIFRPNCTDWRSMSAMPRSRNCARNWQHKFWNSKSSWTANWLLTLKSQPIDASSKERSRGERERERERGREGERERKRGREEERKRERERRGR